MSTSPENAVRLIRGFDAMDVTDLLPDIRTPTLVLHSRNDCRVPFAEGYLVASSIPHAEFVPLESRNHILLDHQPAWRQFFAEIARFVRGPAAADARDRIPRTHRARARSSRSHRPRVRQRADRTSCPSAPKPCATTSTAFSANWARPIAPRQSCGRAKPALVPCRTAQTRPRVPEFSSEICQIVTAPRPGAS